MIPSRLIVTLLSAASNVPKHSVLDFKRKVQSGYIALALFIFNIFDLRLDHLRLLEHLQKFRNFPSSLRTANTLIFLFFLGYAYILIFGSVFPDATNVVKSSHCRITTPQ
jgi:hypothetical protein